MDEAAQSGAYTQGRATEREAGLPMAQKHTWPRQKVTLKITQAQAVLILENDCIDQEVLDSLDFSERTFDRPSAHVKTPWLRSWPALSWRSS